MSTSDSTLKGKYDEVAGKVKQGVGEAFNDQSTANAGAAQQVKGQAEQAWGAVKEGFQDSKERNGPRAEAEAHNTRSGIADAAENVKNHIKAGVDSLKK